MRTMIFVQSGSGVRRRSENEPTTSHQVSEYTKRVSNERGDLPPIAMRIITTGSEILNILINRENELIPNKYPHTYGYLPLILQQNIKTKNNYWLCNDYKNCARGNLVYVDNHNLDVPRVRYMRKIGIIPEREAPFAPPSSNHVKREMARGRVGRLVARKNQIMAH